MQKSKKTLDKPCKMCYSIRAWYAKKLEIAAETVRVTSVEYVRKSGEMGHFLRDVPETPEKMFKLLPPTKTNKKH